ncbi:MAG: peptidase M22 [Opitutaceae bacterium]|nr:peptidase M22 [Opitutaceae bacterium]
MLSLRQLLAAHAPLLLIDAASTRVQVGLLTAGGDARWAVSDEEAGVGVFRSVEALGVELGAVRAFVFCDGPGSVLGIRTVAMAVRTWCGFAPRPVFAFCSLACVACALARHELSVIADARRNSWHHFALGGVLRRVPNAELTGELVMPESFRHWSPLPAGVKLVPYSLADLLPRVMDAGLFHETHAPDAFLHEEPDYKAWVPHIHRAPATQ